MQAKDSSKPNVIPDNSLLRYPKLCTYSALHLLDGNEHTDKKPGAGENTHTHQSPLKFSN